MGRSASTIRRNSCFFLMNTKFVNRIQMKCKSHLIKASVRWLNVKRSRRRTEYKQTFRVSYAREFATLPEREKWSAHCRRTTQGAAPQNSPQKTLTLLPQHCKSTNR